MPATTRPSPYPEAGGSYYYPSDDFKTWRVQFEAIRDRYQWMDAVAKQFAFAYMRDSATEAVMDLTYSGPETLTKVLNAYETRFRLLDNLVRLRLQREGLLRRPCRRRQPGGRRRSLLKPRPRHGILAPDRRPPPIESVPAAPYVSRPSKGKNLPCLRLSRVSEDEP